MSDIFSSYAPDEVVVIITHPTTGVTHRVVGFMEDSFITIQRDKEPWTLVTGSDGRATRVHNANNSGKITLDLMQTSPSNAFLSSMFNYDSQHKNNDGVFNIMVKDATGLSVDNSSSAFIATYPERVYGSGVNGRSWVIGCGVLESFIGGNEKLDVATVTAITGLGYDVDNSWKQ